MEREKNAAQETRKEGWKEEGRGSCALLAFGAVGNVTAGDDTIPTPFHQPVLIFIHASCNRALVEI